MIIFLLWWIFILIARSAHQCLVSEEPTNRSCYPPHTYASVGLFFLWCWLAFQWPPRAADWLHPPIICCSRWIVTRRNWQLVSFSFSYLALLLDSARKWRWNYGRYQVSRSSSSASPTSDRIPHTSNRFVSFSIISRRQMTGLVMVLTSLNTCWYVERHGVCTAWKSRTLVNFVTRKERLQ